MVVSCLTLFFASFRVGKIFNRNNISYDIYLFHMPVILTVYSLSGKDSYDLAITFSLILVITILLGSVSWFGIGRKFMYRKKLNRIVRK